MRSSVEIRAPKLDRRRGKATINPSQTFKDRLLKSFRDRSKSPREKATPYVIAASGVIGGTILGALFGFGAAAATEGNPADPANATQEARTAQQNEYDQTRREWALTGGIAGFSLGTLWATHVNNRPKNTDKTDARTVGVATGPPPDPNIINADGITVACFDGPATSPDSSATPDVSVNTQTPPPPSPFLGDSTNTTLFSQL